MTDATTEDLGPEPPEGFDPQDIRVNFSDEEASSEARDYTPVPTGKYFCNITEIEVRYSKSEKNYGKPYWSVELTVQEGPFEDRKFWSNVMLFDGALYSLAQLLKSVGREEALNNGQIPAGEELVGESTLVSVVKQRDNYKEKQYDDGEKYFKNEVKGFKPVQGSASEAVSGQNAGSESMLP